MNLVGKSKLCLKAPAKVNLRLKVLGRRSDGYHDLQMVMVPLDLADELEVERVDGGIEIRSDSTAVPADRSNILWKAAEALKERSQKDFGIRIFLKKKIPVAAGLGGGSSDAAALLKGISEAFDLGLSAPDLREAAVKLGADVPFFLTAGPQIAEGIGEKLTPIKIPPLWIVLVNPGFPISTKEVYGWYDQEGGRGPSSKLTDNWSDASFPPLENDLEAAVIPRYPVLAEMKRLLSRAGALGTLMSGSGPTVFGLFESQESRDRGYEKVLQEKDPKWWICRTASV